MKKNFYLSIISLQFVVWMTMAQSPIIGTWKGSYGNGASQTGNFYSFRFNTDGTLNVLYPDGNIICSGKYTITNNTVTGTYYYNGNQPYSVAGTYNPSNNTITGTYGAGSNTSGGGSWIMTTKVGGTPAPTAAAIPFGSTQPYTKAAPSGTTQPAASQTMTAKPGSSGMTIVGIVKLPASFKTTTNDGINVTTQLQPSNQASESYYPKISVDTTRNTQTASTNGSVKCTPVSKKLTVTGNSFLNSNYGPRMSSVYPGAIYVFDEFMRGNYRPIEQSRNPVTITSNNVSNTTGQVYANVSAPTKATLMDGMGQIVQRYDKTVGSGNTEYQVYEAHNSTELMMAASAGGSYAGFSVSGGFQKSDNSNYYFFTVDGFKPMYTIEVNNPSNGYFSEQSIINNNGPLMVIKSVTYGTRVLANVRMNSSNSQLDINFKASLNAFGATGNAAFNFLKNSTSADSQINMFVVGGPTTTTVYFDPASLRDGIENIMKTTTLNMAQPIAFTIADINGNNQQIISATDTYNDQICIPVNAIYTLASARLEVTTGNDDPKNAGSTAQFYLINKPTNVPAGMTFNVLNPTDKSLLVAADLSSNNIEFPRNAVKSINLPVKYSDTKYVGLNTFTSGRAQFSFTPVQIGLGSDEWQVVRVILFLKFVDQNGKPLQLQGMGLNSLDEIALEYKDLNIYLKKDKPALALPFSFDGTTFIAGGAYQ